MTSIYEFVRLNRGFMLIADHVGIRMDDYSLIGMPEDFDRLNTMRYKKAYIIKELAKKYNVGEKRILEAYNRFSKQFDIEGTEFINMIDELNKKL